MKKKKSSKLFWVILIIVSLVIGMFVGSKILNKTDDKYQKLGEDCLDSLSDLGEGIDWYPNGSATCGEGLVCDVFKCVSE